MTHEADERSEAAPQKGPSMPQDRISYPFESDIERHAREAQDTLWDPQAIIDGKGPPRCHKLVPGSESVAYCGRTFGPGTRQPSPTPPGAYLCRVCLRLHGRPW